MKQIKFTTNYLVMQLKGYEVSSVFDTTIIQFFLQKFLYQFYQKSRFLRFPVKIFFLVYHIIGYPKKIEKFPPGDSTTFFRPRKTSFDKKKYCEPAGRLCPGAAREGKS